MRTKRSRGKQTGRVLLGKVEAAHSPLFNFISRNFALIFILACCALYAAQLGIFEPHFDFQKTPQQALFGAACAVSVQGLYAYAAGDELLLYLPHGGASAAAIFSGSGKAGSMQVEMDEPGMRLERLVLNGKEICAPCENGKTYAVSDLDGKFLAVEAKSADGGAGYWNGTGTPRLAFFQQVVKTHVAAPLHLKISGWVAETNQRMPSSFYGEDAPFHIRRVALLADYLTNGKWPWATYSFVSVLPPALFHAAFGVPHEYAFKLYEIALFFVPVLLFWLFSRKFPVLQDAAFLFASLAYLFLPTQGYPLGNGADLFLYGMMPHALATYLSLAFFYFAYEALLEKKAGSLLPAVLFFLLAAAANPRILLALAVALAVLAAGAAASGRLRRLAILAIACAAATIWLAFAFLQDFDFGGYSSLGGVAAGGAEGSLLLLLQAGYGVMPVFFAVGAWLAWKQRNLFVLLVAAYSAVMFVIATSPAIAAAVPFADALRFLPSFYLPFVFAAGAGAAAFWGKTAAWLESARRKWKIRVDRDTLAVAFMIAILAPFAALLFGLAQSGTDEYVSKLHSLEAASDYSSFEQARMVIGSERALLVTRAGGSEYPPFDSWLEKTGIAYHQDADGIASEMQRLRLRYVMAGNALSQWSASDVSAWELVKELGADPRFERVLSGGTVQVYALRGAAAAPDVWGKNAAVEKAELLLDRAEVSGECFADACEALVYSQAMPASAACSSELGGCSVVYDKETGAWRVSGIKRGRFSFVLAPVHSGMEAALLFLGALVFIACARYFDERS